MVCYQVANLTQQTIIATEVELAQTSWRRMKGLLGRSRADFSTGKGLWIVPSQGIHTIGMSFPIDVVYLDGKKQVIHLCHELAPFRIAALKRKAHSVLELPAGSLINSRTSVGDQLEISEIEI